MTPSDEPGLSSPTVPLQRRATRDRAGVRRRNHPILASVRAESSPPVVESLSADPVEMRSPSGVIRRSRGPGPWVF